jgi:hypothetical protein
VVANVLAMKEYFGGSVALNVSPTVQALNVLNLADLLQWCDQHGLKMVLYNSVTEPAYHAKISAPQPANHAVDAQGFF